MSAYSITRILQQAPYLQIDLAMKLMECGITHAAVQQGLKQLQKKLVNAGRKVTRSSAKCTAGGEL